MRAALARAQVVEAREFRIFGGGGEKVLPLLLRPFVVHQLVDRFARRAPCAPQQPQGDAAIPNTASAPRMRSALVEHQRGDHRAVEHQVRLVVDVVGPDRDRAGARDHAPLIPEQHERRARSPRATRRCRSRIAAVSAPLMSRSTARQAMPIADTAISTTWTSAASASALPWPKRWSWSAGCGRDAHAQQRRSGWRPGRARCRRGGRASPSNRSHRPPRPWRRAARARSPRWRARRARRARMRGGDLAVGHG